MSIMDVFKGMTAFEIEGMFDSLDDAFDESFDRHDQPTMYENLSKPFESRYGYHPQRHARVQ